MYIEGINIIEVVLKKELDIPLTKEEIKCLKSTDDDVRELILQLINGEDYRQEAIKILTEMMSNVDELPELEQQIIRQKCQDKIDSLLNIRKIY